MNKELDAKLVQKFPKIFKNRYYKTALNWGFACGDGWYNVIYSLCKNIQQHINRSRKNRLDALIYNRALSRALKGDFSSYQRLNEWERMALDKVLDDPEPQLKIVPNACCQVVATQVKEKFGSLRFYYVGGDKVIDGMVDLAETLSSVTCEECGSPGVLRLGGWLRVLCDQHAEGKEPFENSPF